MFACYVEKDGFPGHGQTNTASDKVSVILRCSPSSPFSCSASSSLHIPCRISFTLSENLKSPLNVLDVLKMGLSAYFWCSEQASSLSLAVWWFLSLGFHSVWNNSRKRVEPAWVTVLILKCADPFYPDPVNMQWVSSKKAQFVCVLSPSQVQGWSLLPHSDVALIYPTSLMLWGLGWFFFWITPYFQQEFLDNTWFPAGRLGR